MDSVSTERLEQFVVAEDRDRVLSLLGGDLREFYALKLRNLLNGGNERAGDLRKAVEEARKALGERDSLVESYDLAHRFVAAGDPAGAFDRLVTDLRARFDPKIPAPPRDAHQAHHATGAGGVGVDAVPTTVPDSFPTIDLLTHSVGALSDQGVVDAIRALVHAAPSSAGSRRDAKRCRDLMQRATRLDFPEALAAAELVMTLGDRSGGDRFGCVPSTALLPEATLCELAARDAAAGHARQCRSSEAYVAARLARCRPPPYVDLELDDAARGAYLASVEAIGDEVAPAFRCLGAFASFHRLSAGAARGEFDLGAFVGFVRATSRSLEEAVREARARGGRAAHARRDRTVLSGGFRAELALPPPTAAAVDELERAFLARAASALAEEEARQPLRLRGGRIVGAIDARTAWRGLAPYVEPERLREARFLARVHAVGTAEEAAALAADADAWQRRMLTAVEPAVEISFAEGTPSVWAPADAVALDVAVKNVARLLVKVFEINTTAFYRETGGAIKTGINLDGLIPSLQWTVDLEAHPLRREVRRIEVPALEGRRGVFVVELIGNGKSARAVLRKGQMRLVQRAAADGAAFVVVDEGMRPFPPQRCSLALGGVVHRANASGVIVVPYPASRGPSSALVTVAESDEPGAWTFSALERVSLPQEGYSLSASAYVDRDALVDGNSAATLVARAQLRNCAGVQVPLSRLAGAALEIETADGNGTVSSLPPVPVDLSDDRDLTHAFRVPAGVRRLRVRITAHLLHASDGKKQSFEVSTACAVNAAQDRDTWTGLYLRRDAAGYHVALRGKAGEPCPGEVLTLRVRPHAMGRGAGAGAWPSAQLRTGPAGEVHLGSLDTRAAEIRVEAPRVPGAQPLSFAFPGPRATLPPRLHLPSAAGAGAGAAAAELPWTGPLPRGALTRDDASLLELSPASRPDSGGAVSVLRDAFAALRFVAHRRALQIGSLKDGLYQLRLHGSGDAVTLQVGGSRGEDEAMRSFLVGGSRVAELPMHTTKIPSVAEAASDGDVLRIRVANATRGTRVHVLSRHFAPAEDVHAVFTPEEHLGLATTAFGHKRSQFVEGRTLSDEYIYIMQRQQSGSARAGNSLSKPGMLANRTAVGATETRALRGAEGTRFADKAMTSALCREEALRRRADRQRGGGGGRRDDPTRDFLRLPGAAATNLRPDAEGVVKVPLAALNGDVCGEATVVVADRHSAAATEVALGAHAACAEDFGAEGALYRDLRLRSPLSADRHYARTNEVTLVAAGERVAVARSAFVLLDSLARVATLHRALSGGRSLEALDAALRWHTLADADKRSEYRARACHELHVFLWHRDRAFFDACVRPLLDCKVQPAFVDELLLGRNLAPWAEQPHKFASLNLGEKAMLAAALGGGGGEAVAGWLRAHADAAAAAAAPADRDRAFETAIKLSAVAGGDDDEMVVAGEAECLAGAAPRSMAAMAAMAMPPPPPSAPGGASRSLLQIGGAGRSRNAAMARRAAPARKKKQRKAREVSDSSDAEEAALSDSDASSDAALSDSSGAGGGRDASDDEWERGQASMALAPGGAARRGFRPMEKTQEFVEANYSGRAEGSPAFEAAAFWADYAEHALCGSGPFLSRGVVARPGSLSESVFMLAVLPLPADAASVPRHEMGVTRDGRVAVTAASPLVACHREVTECAADPSPTLIVAQHFADAREGPSLVLHRPDRLLANRCYRLLVVVTNTGSERQRVRVLSQVPEGAVPLGSDGREAVTSLQVEPYHTARASLLLYFPRPGTFRHFPAHASREDEAAAVGFAQPATVVVALRHDTVDTRSWADVAATGSDDDVIEYLEAHGAGAGGASLELVRWRLRGRAFFDRLTALLARRLRHDRAVWEAALTHGDRARLVEWAAMEPAVARALPPGVPSPLLPRAGPRGLAVTDAFQLREFDPVVSERAFRLGRARKVANEAVERYFRALLLSMAAEREPCPDAWVALSCCFVLQGRVEEATAAFDRACKPRASADAAPEPRDGLVGEVQFDYMAVYLAFSLVRGDEVPAYAQRIARAYAEYPALAWRRRFAEASAQLAEAAGGAGGLVVETASRDQQQDRAAFRQPAVSLKCEGGALRLRARNVGAAAVRFYRVDVEHLFSSSPFMTVASRSHFASVRPNASAVVELGAGAPGEERSALVAPPPELAGRNLVVEAEADGARSLETLFAASMAVQTMPAYGQLRATASDSGRPLPRVYVKAYARSAAGAVSFYKDGFTDVRGRFDYASLTTGALDEVARFALLVVSEAHGATVLEVGPPHNP